MDVKEAEEAWFNDRASCITCGLPPEDFIEVVDGSNVWDCPHCNPPVNAEGRPELPEPPVWGEQEHQS